MANEAMRFWRRKDRLKVEIDGLLRDLYHDWIGDASALKSMLEKSSKAVDAAVKDIERKIKTEQNIVKALGYIDDAIEIAAGLVR